MLKDFQRYWHGDQDEIQLLLDLRDPDERSRHRLAALLAVCIEFFVVALFLNLPAGAPAREWSGGVTFDPRHVTPLYIPQDLRNFQLTQKEPQHSKPAAEVNLEQLLPRAARVPSPAPSPAPPVRTERNTPSAMTPPSPAGRTETARVEPPRIEVEQSGTAPLPAGPAPAVPPPPKPPKLAFEPVGGGQSKSSGVPAGQAALRPPSANVGEATRQVARSGSTGRLVVGDAPDIGPVGGIDELLRQTPSPGRRGSALELLSDPQGIDFKPYLIQVLAVVRRNWTAVLPESARFGQQGRVVVQFTVDRAGSVPKLVIATPSGTGALDRAAVAGISASVPLPPLPAEYKGSEIRLQLVFSYNMPQR